MFHVERMGGDGMKVKFADQEITFAETTAAVTLESFEIPFPDLEAADAIIIKEVTIQVAGGAEVA